ncbi:MAG: preprotein translocase subunit SecE [Solirubrobacterales bacterium]
MAKSRAQRKAEAARKRRQAELGVAEERDEEARAQHDTQVPESAYELEAELAIEHGAEETPDEALEGPAPARPGRREERRQRKEAERRAAEQAARRAAKEPVAERERGPVLSFFSSVIKELRKVQWPDRDTLVQASAVTLLFVAVAAAYLGALDAIFSRLIDLLI